MIEHATRLRILMYLWGWPPESKPQATRADGRYILSWSWNIGTRAIQRLRYLPLCPQLLSDVRRRIYTSCSDDELHETIRQAKEEFSRYSNVGYIGDRMELRLLDTGSVEFLAPKTKKRQSEEERLADAEALALLEEEEAEDADSDPNDAAGSG